jgi:N-acetylglucosamine kinase-like BadF-type ATPase
MNHCFLGVDIGGTKSHALVADDRGQAIGFATGGAGSYEVAGWDGLRGTLKAVTAEAIAAAGITPGDISGAGFGVAGYDWPAEREPHQRAIEALGLACPYGLVNDAVIGLIAGAREGWGVAVAAGTGNNVRGRDRQGCEGQVTGCGLLYGEHGGAVEMVRKALHAVAYAWTLRGPATRLTEAFIAATGARDATDLLQGVAVGHYALSPAHAPLIFEAARKGDQVAQGIVRWAGDELGRSALAVIRQLGFQDLVFDTVLIGSVFKGGAALVEALRARIHSEASGARLVRLAVPPVTGGVLLAMEVAGVQAAGVRGSLMSSTEDLLEGRRQAAPAGSQPKPRQKGPS